MSEGVSHYWFEIGEKVVYRHHGDGLNNTKLRKVGIRENLRNGDVAQHLDGSFSVFGPGSFYRDVEFWWTERPSCAALPSLPSLPSSLLDVPEIRKGMFEGAPEHFKPLTTNIVLREENGKLIRENASLQTQLDTVTDGFEHQKALVRIWRQKAETAEECFHAAAMKNEELHDTLVALQNSRLGIRSENEVGIQEQWGEDL